MSADEAPGMHGKLPSHGDFITRRLPRDFLDTWDDWLQRLIATSKTELGERWLDTYLTSPIWSFVLSAGVCGPARWAGVLMPSVDRVGRYFPLTLATRVSGCAPLETVTAAGDWFERAREVALSCLEEAEFELDAFDAAVAGLGTLGSVPAHDEWRLPAGASSERGLCVPLVQPAEPTSALVSLAHCLVERMFGQYSVWWSEGSEQVAPSMLMTGGLPSASACTALLDGRFTPDHWVALAPATATDGGV